MMIAAPEARNNDGQGEQADVGIDSYSDSDN